MCALLFQPRVGTPRLIGVNAAFVGRLWFAIQPDTRLVLLRARRGYRLPGACPALAGLKSGVAVAPDPVLFEPPTAVEFVGDPRRREGPRCTADWRGAAGSVWLATPGLYGVASVNVFDHPDVPPAFTAWTRQ